MLFYYFILNVIVLSADFSIIRTADSVAQLIQDGICQSERTAYLSSCASRSTEVILNVPKRCTDAVIYCFPLLHPAEDWCTFSVTREN